MSNKFDLERYKAGEPAWCQAKNAEFEYVATLPNGGIISRYLQKYASNHTEWYADVSSPQILHQHCTMKPKEEWIYIWNQAPNIFPTKQKAEEALALAMEHQIVDKGVTFSAVRIVRD